MSASHLRYGHRLLAWAGLAALAATGVLGDLTRGRHTGNQGIHGQDSVVFSLRWTVVPDGRGEPDSFDVRAGMGQGQGSTVLVNRWVPAPPVNFVAPASGESFYATVRAARGERLSKPVGLVWRFPPSDLRDSMVPSFVPIDLPVLELSERPGLPPNRTGAASSSVQSESCSHEPRGFMLISDASWVQAPPAAPGRDPNGWSILARPQLIRTVLDPTGPQNGKSVLEGRFPMGMPGGRGPFRMDRRFDRAVSAVYMCTWLKVSGNFTDNGNVGTKFGFLLTPYKSGQGQLNHYFNLTKRLGINLQSAGGRLNRLMFANYQTLAHLGEWHMVEWLVVGNTRGRADGTARIWVDGALLLDVTNVRYFFPDQDAAFEGVTWNPTYGGGLNPVPQDLYMWIARWYISGR